MSAPPVQVCTYPDYPARRHGHYGGRYWCTDFNSPLLSEDNGAAIQGRWILIFEKAS
jgi:hypothetical protein